MKDVKKVKLIPNDNIENLGALECLQVSGVLAAGDIVQITWPNKTKTYAIWRTRQTADHVNKCDSCVLGDRTEGWDLDLCLALNCRYQSADPLYVDFLRAMKKERKHGRRKNKV